MSIEQLKAASRAAGYAMVPSDETADRVKRVYSHPAYANKTASTETLALPAPEAKPAPKEADKWQVPTWTWTSGFGWRPTAS